MPHREELSSLLLSPPTTILPTVGASPFTYTAPANGAMYVIGGTLSSVEVGRAGTFISLAAAAQRFAYLSRGDQLRVTYTAAPTLNFFQSP